MQQFGDLTASELYCPQCRVSRPVREKLLLILPTGELHEYVCAQCGTSVGQRTVTGPQIAPVRPGQAHSQSPGRKRLLS